MRLYSLVFEQSGHGASRQHLLLMPKELTKAAALTSSDDMKTCAACSLAELRLVLLQTCHWKKNLDELSHHFNRAHGMETCHPQDHSLCSLRSLMPLGVLLRYPSLLEQLERSVAALSILSLDSFAHQILSYTYALWQKQSYRFLHTDYIYRQ